MKIISNTLRATVLVSTGTIGILTTTLSSEAATLALAEGTVVFNQFTQLPVGTETSANANTLTLSNESPVVAEATANAFFDSVSPLALNTVISQALGSGSNYLGIAESEASILGQFEIAANTTFGFDFFGNLNLQTQIDDPGSERADATTGITFALISLPTPGAAPTTLDAFEVFGQLETPGNNDQLTAQSTPLIDWQFDQADLLSNLQGLTESAIASFAGTYRRFFGESTLLTLVEVKTSQAEVKTVPEVSSVIALLLTGSALIGVKRCRSI
jgi:hypothetical protein